MNDAEDMAWMLDLTTRRVRGVTYWGRRPFDVTVITRVDAGNLWMGACPEPVLPAYFTYVLNLYPEHVYSTEAEIRLVRLHDSEFLPRPELLEELAAWVNEKRHRGPTLVHCQMGLNRSALVVGLALIRAGMPADEAIRHLRAKRSPAVLCNPYFEEWLRGADASSG